MTFFKGLFQHFVEKRLWPAALALVVAILAVPVVLSSPAGDEQSKASDLPPASPLLGRASSALLRETKLAVTVVNRTPFRRRLRRLPAKNPFVQQAKPKPVADPALEAGGSSTGASPDGSGAGTPTSGSGTGSGTGSDGAAPVSRGTGTVKQKRFLYTAVVEFGEIDDTKKKTLDPTDSLPNDEDSIVIYLGSDGKSALFLASSGVTARGDGSCEPSESNCSILRMRKGDVEFFEVPSGGDTVTTYQLELKAIAEKEVSPAKTSRRSSKKSSRSSSTKRSSHSSTKVSDRGSKATARQRKRRARSEVLRAQRFFDALVHFGR